MFQCRLLAQRTMIILTQAFLTQIFTARFLLALNNLCIEAMVQMAYLRPSFFMFSRTLTPNWGDPNIHPPTMDLLARLVLGNLQ